VFPTTDRQPLHQTPVKILDSLRVFDDFKELASQPTAELRRRRRLDPKFRGVLPTLVAGESTVLRLKRKLKRLARLREQNRPRVAMRRRQLEDAIKRHQRSAQWVYVLFTLDFGKTKKRLLKEFETWLDLAENKKRFLEHARDPKGRTHVFKDRLKDLATWRLYDGLQNEDLARTAAPSKFDRLIAFTNANRRPGKAFHDARQGQSAEPAEVYADQQQCFNALQRARDYLAEIIPVEFGEPPAR
jgi:hypothetical protein